MFHFSCKKPFYLPITLELFINIILQVLFENKIEREKSPFRKNGAYLYYIESFTMEMRSCLQFIIVDDSCPLFYVYFTVVVLLYLNRVE